MHGKLHGLLRILLLCLIVFPSYADESASKPADPTDLLNQARSLVQKNQYDAAHEIYTSLLKQEAADSPQQDQLHRERDYVLPYYEALNYFDNAQLEEARTVIVQALRDNQKYPDRQLVLRKLGAEILRTQEDRGSDGEPLEKTISRTVEVKLENYFRETGAFPLNYKELNQLLPPERGVLRWYDVIDYVGSRDRYRIRLRNRRQHAQVLDLAGGSFIR